jgi:putative PIN family toxin of toxin-antitoxin system
MRVVIDTNSLLVSISSKSKFHKVLEEFLRDKFELLLSNEIIYEYLEVIERKISKATAENICSSLLNSDSAILINTYFKMNLIHADPDDNKFVDCALAGNADYIVTDDKHFEELKKIDFPKINTITTEEFLKLISEN